MPVPTHSFDCQTSIFPTRCRYCEEDIYFFSCTCGSKVYFDLPEPPWNPHENRCIKYLIHYYEKEENYSIQHIQGIVKRYAEEKGLIIPAEVSDYLDEVSKTGSKRKSKSIIRPGDQQIQIWAEVVNVLDVNFFKRLNIPDNQNGRSFLGELIRTSYVEIKLKERVEDFHTIYIYETYIPTKNISKSNIQNGTVLLVELTPKTIPCKDTIWLISDILHIIH